MTIQDKKKWGFIAGIVALIGVIIFLIYSSYYESTDDAFLEAHVTNISPQVAGHVLKVNVLDNQLVHQGDVLIEIDPRDFQTKVDEAKAGLQMAQVNATKVETDLKRYQLLIARDEISKEEFDHAQDDVASNEAQVTAKKAILDQAELNLSYTKLIAPSEGYVTQKSVEPGSYVQVGQSLFSLVSPDVWVVANFKEGQLVSIKPGQSVKIKIDSMPDKHFYGHVDSIQYGSGERFSLFPPENATGNFVKVVQRVPVKILFDNPLEDLRGLGPGISVIPTVKVK